jgi:hypothetical protein
VLQDRGQPVPTNPTHGCDKIDRRERLFERRSGAGTEEHGHEREAPTSGMKVPEVECVVFDLMRVLGPECGLADLRLHDQDCGPRQHDGIDSLPQAVQGEFEENPPAPDPRPIGDHMSEFGSEEGEKFLPCDRLLGVLGEEAIRRIPRMQAG